MKLITDIAPRIREVNRIIAGCSSGTMPFEQAFVLARFYYDFQDTNAIIAEAEAMTVDDLNGLRNVAVSLKAGTATLINNIRLLSVIDFREIATAHSRYYHALFQKASDELNPYWKRYCELNNRLDYLPLGSNVIVCFILIIFLLLSRIEVDDPGAVADSQMMRAASKWCSCSFVC